MDNFPVDHPQGQQVFMMVSVAEYISATYSDQIFQIYHSLENQFADMDTKYKIGIACAVITGKLFEDMKKNILEKFNEIKTENEAAALIFHAVYEFTLAYYERRKNDEK